MDRYAIDHTSAEWAQAEAHVAKLADPAKRKDVSTVVSLKGTAAPKKRIAEGEASGQATKKKNRRSSKGAKK